MQLTAALRDLNKLNTFVRVAGRRSFTKAAEDLRTTPSVVSKHMKELEESLGLNLMSRSTHGIVLTDTGESLFQLCLQMMTGLDDFLTEARNRERGPVGTLRVLATDDLAYWLITPLIVRFSNEHAALRTHLSVISDDAAPSGDGFDVIVATKKPSLPGFVEHDLGQVKHVICGSPGYFARRGCPNSPQDLRKHNCLANHSSGPKEWPFEIDQRPSSVEIAGSLSCDKIGILVQMAAADCGVARVPAHAVIKELQEKKLAPILEETSASPEHAYAFIPRSKHLPVKTTAFLAFLSASWI
jgi:DNA-binding transcriptional LysR family regulator